MILRPWQWLLVLLLVAGFWLVRMEPAKPGLDVPVVDLTPTSSAPSQRILPGTTSIRKDDHQIRLLAEFAIDARILGRENYRLGRESNLSPWDFALGWGEMAKPEVIDQFSIRQSGRWYYWRSDNLPIPRRTVETSSANMHLVPASEQVREQLEEYGEGDSISFKGYLIEVNGDDGWRWRSSLTREDTGNGACELVLVTEVL